MQIKLSKWWNSYSNHTDVLSRQSLVKQRKDYSRIRASIDILINGAGGNHSDAITGPEIFEEDAEGKSFFDLDENGVSMYFH